MANQKRISELPIINALSGSAASVIPVVVGGTTNQIPAERFSEFVNAYNATTSSNTFIGNQTITGDLDVSGNAIIGGDVEVAGMITAQQYNVTYVSSSIQYKSGSTEFGDTADDTHIFTGTIVLNGLALGTPELMAYTSSQNTINTSVDAHILKQSIQTGSQDLVNLRISSTTGSINTTTSSFDSVFLRISSTTGSINTTTSSFNSEFGKIGSTTSSLHFTTQSLNTQTGSQDLVNLGISSVTGSLIGITNGLMAFTAALDDNYATDAQLYQLYQSTRSLEIQTGSQNSINSGISAVTGAFSTELGSINSHILKQATQTGSQDLVNLGISTYTGSNESWKAGVRGEVSALEAWTASLDSTYATDAQLYQLYQATRSLEIQTGSQNSINSGISAVTGAFATELGSIDSHILGVSTYTSSQNVINTSVDSHILKQATQTGSQDLVNLGISSVTGSLIGITNGLMAFTSALDSTYATDAQVAAAVAGLNTQTGSQDLVNLGISSSTGSILTQIGELQTQNNTQTAINFGISVATASLRDEIGGIEAYTASLKGAIEISGQDVNVLGMITAQQFNVTYVSSSTMYQSGSTKFGNTNDDKHEFTGSINLTGTQTFASTAGSGLRVYGAAGTHQWDVYLNGENLRISDNTAGDGALVVDKRASFGGPVTSSVFNVVTAGATGVIMNQDTGNAGVSARLLFMNSLETGWGLMNESGRLSFRSGSIPTQTSGTEYVSFTPNGDVNIIGGNLVVANGNGINFGATSDGSGTTTSELFDDYEEGTWSPSIVGSTFSGTINGYYTKIGRQVFIQIQFINQTLASSSGQAEIGNLPFASTAFSAVSITYADSLPNNTTGFVNQSNTNIKFVSGTTTSDATWVDGSGNKSLMLTATYFTS